MCWQPNCRHEPPPRAAPGGLTITGQAATRRGEWGADPAIRGWGRSDSELGPGSVSGGPHLSAGFIGTLTSGYVDTGDLRQHVVTGGEGRRYCCTAGRRPANFRLLGGMEIRPL